MSIISRSDFEALRLFCAHFRHLEFWQTPVLQSKTANYFHITNEIETVIFHNPEKIIKNFNEYTPYPSPSKK